MKKLIPFITFFLIFAFSVSGFAYENIIDDYADLFTDSEEAAIQASIESFSEKKDYSLAVVTTDDTAGASSRDFADVYHDYLIDNEGWQENGLLFLIDMDNRSVWISTCGECQLAYNDGEIDNIIDSGFDNLVNGYYADCILNMTEAARFTDTEIDNDDDYLIDESGAVIFPDGYDYDTYDYDTYDYGLYNGGYSYDNSFDIGDALIYIVIGLAAGAIAVFAVKSRYKNTGKGDEFDADDLALKLTASNDNIISRNVITTRIPRNTGNHHHSGRSGGGGSTVHRSSGGRSHGGGGRRF